MRQIECSGGSAHTKFVQVVDKVFRDGVNWARIVAYFCIRSETGAVLHGQRLTTRCRRDNPLGWKLYFKLVGVDL